MFVSMNWIQDYVDLSGLDIESLIKRFTLSTAEVEDIIYKGRDVQGVIIAEIKSVEKVPDSKKLHLLEIDTGNGICRCVCGAPNVEVGQRVAYAPVGSHVVGGPITEVKIAGCVSQGMCCGEDELGISDDHSGLMVIDSDAPLGTDLKSVYKIDDIIFEVDNKSLTNRPDLWGIYGIAREFSVIAERTLKPLDLKIPEYKGDNKIDVSVLREDLTYRYTCMKFRNITRKVSPTDWRIRLFYCGMRSINFMVDITNLIMLEMGQPTHAFDGSRIKNISIGTEKNPIKFKTLDGVERDIDTSTLLIYTNGVPSAVAGIMGGLDSEIEGESDSVVLESATFDGVSVRKSSQHLGLRTDASMRYEKMIDPELTIQAVYRFWSMVSSMDPGAEPDSLITDVYVRKYPQITIDFTKGYIDRYTGIDISADLIQKTLVALGFGVSREGDVFSVKVPSWRGTKDVSLKADIVEEVSRIYGYDNFAVASADSLLKPVPETIGRKEDNLIKDILVRRFSFHEVHSYIWYEGKRMADLKLDIEDNPRLLNSVTPENVVLRNSMIPSLLCFAFKNKSWKTHYNIFEIGRVVKGVTEDGLCNERKTLGAVFYSKEKTEKDLFFEACSVIKYLVKAVKHEVLMEYKVEEVEHSWQHPKNTFGIFLEGKKIGYICTFHPLNAQAFDKNGVVVAFEFDMEDFNSVEEKPVNFMDPSRFPVVDYDISLVLPKGCGFSKVPSLSKSLNMQELTGIQLIDVYELPNEVSATVRFSFAAFERTLTMEEVQGFIEKILGVLEKENIKARF